MRLLPHIALVLLLGSLSGCNRAPAFQGKWEFDRAYSEAQLSKEEQSQTVPKLFSPLMILRELDGSALWITPKEIIFKGGIKKGKSLTYEVIDHPQQDLWRIKDSDGTTADLILENGRLVFYSTGGAPFKAYYKRVSQ